MEVLVQLLALVFTALALVPAAAHLLDLPHKLPLPRHEYLTVQQVYRDWNRFAVIVIASLIVTLWMAIQSQGAARTAATLAFAAILATQVVFWAFTFPVNRRTHDWT